MRPILRYLRRHIWRPSHRRYLLILLCKFLECWWNSTWLYLGFAAVLAAFMADSVKGEPTIILLSIAMVLTVRNLRDARVVSILTGVLGIFAALLSFPAQSEVDALNIELWAYVGLLIGAAFLTSIMLMIVYIYIWDSMRRKGRERRRKRAGRKRRCS